MDQHIFLPSPGRGGAGGDRRAVRAPRIWPVIAQAALVVAGAVSMIAAPPATGRMLLVPLDGGGRDTLAQVATRAGAALVASGPFQNSLIVSGERSALLGAMVQGRMLVLRAVAGGCGEEVRDGGRRDDGGRGI